ncbi:membrane or secreted protein [Neolewinella antarctica]|uniref:Membrane or secreted protein n=1 Tax=Neolewinella antarctica TaxID=442734 RepID=A0ABX0X7W5_9BACT|nr:membrane or secreted protein [Neolewinella antarctica]NJC25313.1 hypothetical protein [Neolewinella antarctica]
MRLLLILLLPILLCTSVRAQETTVSSPTNLIGAWQSSYLTADGRPAKLFMIVAPAHMSMVSYNEADGAFISTLGGSWRADWKSFGVTYEYDSSDTAKVGNSTTFDYELTGDILVFNGSRFWTRVDDGKEGAVAGAWEITGRKVDGKLQDLSDRRTGPRKTMKILSGTRFQWIAYNTNTGQFSGTGGGSYTTNADGLYVEKIEFFSRDDSRVGQQLSFNYAVDASGWVHKGMSSKGDPIHEIWTLRQ